MQLRILLGFAVSLCLNRATIHGDERPITYDKLVAVYSSQAALPIFQGKPSDLVLIASGIANESATPPKNIIERIHNRPTTSSLSVHISGVVRTHFRHSRGTKGSRLPALNETQLLLLKRWLEELPADNKTLPPLNRKFIVQIARGNRFDVRIYDKASLPNELIRVMRLIDTHSGHWSLPLPSQRSAKFSGGPLGWDVAGQRIVAANEGNLQLLDPEEMQVTETVQCPQLRQPIHWTMSPNGRFAALTGNYETYVFDVESWTHQKQFKSRQSYRASFTPDSARLCIMNDTLNTFTTSNWKPCSNARFLDNERDYFVARSGDFAVIGSRNSTGRIWNVRHNRLIRDLGKELVIHQASFSPDASQVALVTTKRPKPREFECKQLHIYSTRDGSLVHELRYHNLARFEEIDDLAWLDGYLLVRIVKIFWNHPEIGIWNLSDGRHRSHLDVLSPLSLAVSPDGKHVFANTETQIHRWSTTELLQTLRNFERSLPKYGNDTKNGVPLLKRRADLPQH